MPTATTAPTAPWNSDTASGPLRLSECHWPWTATRSSATSRGSASREGLRIATASRMLLHCCRERPADSPRLSTLLRTAHATASRMLLQTTTRPNVAFHGPASWACALQQHPGCCCKPPSGRVKGDGGIDSSVHISPAAPASVASFSCARFYGGPLEGILRPLPAGLPVESEKNRLAVFFILRVYFPV